VGSGLQAAVPPFNCDGEPQLLRWAGHPWGAGGEAMAKGGCTSAEGGTASGGKESLFFKRSFQPINHPGGRGSCAQSLGFLQALLRAAHEVSHSRLPNNESLFSPLLLLLPAAPAAFHVWGAEQPKPGELLGVPTGQIQHPAAG